MTCPVLKPTISRLLVHHLKQLNTLHWIKRRCYMYVFHLLAADFHVYMATDCYLWKSITSQWHYPRILAKSDNGAVNTLFHPVNTIYIISSWCILSVNSFSPIYLTFYQPYNSILWMMFWLDLLHRFFHSLLPEKNDKHRLLCKLYSICLVFLAL